MPRTNCKPATMAKFHTCTVLVQIRRDMIVHLGCTPKRDANATNAVRRSRSKSRTTPSCMGLTQKGDVAGDGRVCYAQEAAHAHSSPLALNCKHQHFWARPRQANHRILLGSRPKIAAAPHFPVLSRGECTLPKPTREATSISACASKSQFISPFTPFGQHEAKDPTAVAETRPA